MVGPLPIEHTCIASTEYEPSHSIEDEYYVLNDACFVETVGTARPRVFLPRSVDGAASDWRRAGSAGRYSSRVRLGTTSRSRVCRPHIEQDPDRLHRSTPGLTTWTLKCVVRHVPSDGLLAACIPAAMILPAMFTLNTAAPLLPKSDVHLYMFRCTAWPLPRIGLRRLPRRPRRVGPFPAVCAIHTQSGGPD